MNCPVAPLLGLSKDVKRKWYTVTVAYIALALAQRALHFHICKANRLKNATVPEALNRGFFETQTQ